MPKKDIPWTSAGSYLKQGYRIERFYRVGGEWWVTLGPPNVLASNASKRLGDKKES